MILAPRFTFIVEKVEKTCTFTQKWLEHLLVMTSYLVTIETDLTQKAHEGCTNSY